jgi:GT2 family glycosyltransferase
MKVINVSIVLYHNKQEQIKRIIRSLFLCKNLNIKLYLIDNSRNDTLKELVNIDNHRIEYIFNNKNLGYGKAHNIAIKKSIENGILYHLVLNPDVYFNDNILDELYIYMEKHKDVGNIIPLVKYPNEDIQYLCKLLPSPLDLIFRRFIPFKTLKNKKNDKYELKFTGYDKIMNVPSLSGCFMFLRSDVLKEIGLFDESFFMYLEDVDLNRRIHEKYKTIFYPKVQIYHEYAKDSYKKKKLLIYHIKSAINYFNKWGWIFDKKRFEFNDKIIKEYKNLL